MVVNRLGLDSLSPFNPKERIIEYLVPDGGPEPSLVDQPLRAFVRAVGARSAAPRGRLRGSGQCGPGRRAGLHGRPHDVRAAPV
ncbi:Ftcd [Vulpes lagopus]